MRAVNVAAIQLAVPGWDREANLAEAERMVREAAAQGAQVILLPELFELPYFCTEQDAKHFRHALPYEGHPAITRLSRVAAELNVVLPVSFFERAGNVFFNTVAVIDADGSVLGRYRKTHIPDGPGYSEKYYFTPGDTGFRVWPTRYGTLGVGICWDQWFPETARAMALLGAELLFYPTAIGSEPQDPVARQQRALAAGHAGSRRREPRTADRREPHGPRARPRLSQRYYGSSFIADQYGEQVQKAGRDEPAILLHRFDLDALAETRHAWGVFRDRRPACYGILATSDGEHRTAEGASGASYPRV
jgi:Predicted amidohydrolase